MGGVRMPKSAQWDLDERLRQHEKKWKARDIYFFAGMRPWAAYVRVGFMDPMMEVDGSDCMDLCRLEWIGSNEKWRMSFPRRSGRGFDPAPPPLGTEGGTPETCVDAAIEERLGWDPESPGEESKRRPTQARLQRLFDQIRQMTGEELPFPPP